MMAREKYLVHMVVGSALDLESLVFLLVTCRWSQVSWNIEVCGSRCMPDRRKRYVVYREERVIIAFETPSRHISMGPGGQTT